jgi:hypothetical protein
MTGLTRLDQQCNRTKTQTTEKKEKRKSPRFAFLKISAGTHLAHLQVVRFWLLKKIQPKAARPTANLQKSQIFPPTKDCG